MWTTTTSPTDIGAPMAVTNAKVTKPDSISVSPDRRLAARPAPARQTGGADPNQRGDRR